MLINLLVLLKQYSINKQMLDGIDNSSIGELLNAKSLITLNFESFSTVIFVNDSQFEKQLELIFFTKEGISALFILLVA